MKYIIAGGSVTNINPPSQQCGNMSSCGSQSPVVSDASKLFLLLIFLFYTKQLNFYSPFYHYSPFYPYFLYYSLQFILLDCMSQETTEPQLPVCTPPETTIGSPIMKPSKNGKKILPHLPNYFTY